MCFGQKCKGGYYPKNVLGSLLEVKKPFLFSDLIPLPGGIFIMKQFWKAIGNAVVSAEICLRSCSAITYFLCDSEVCLEIPEIF